LGPWVTAAVVLLASVAVGAALAWRPVRGGVASTTNAPIAVSPFSSAMSKAGVSAAEPDSPVEITTVKPTGSHPFDTTFTGDELAALMNAFSYEATVRGTSFSVSQVRISLAGARTLSLSGEVTASGLSYSGTVSAPVSFAAGRITLTGGATVGAEGLKISGDQAQKATAALLAYANNYLAAAPGLHVESAEVTPQGVHVKGTAPNSLAY